MPNTYRRGFFIKPNGDLSLLTEFPNCPVPWSKEFIVKVDTISQQRLLDIYGGCLVMASGSQLLARDYRGVQSQISTTYPTDGRAFGVGYKGINNAGTPAHQFTRNGDDVGSMQNAVDDARGWNVTQLIAPGYTNTYLSWAQLVNDNGLTATYDANLVPNAAGDGWVSRLQADYGNVAAASDYKLILYDTEQFSSPYNASIPVGAEYIYDADFNEDVTEVRAGQKVLTLTFEPDFDPISAEIGGFSVTVTAQSAGSVTLSFPDMTNFAGFVRFGTQKLSLTDSIGNQVSQTVLWSPATGYGYKDLTGANTTDQASIFYNWGVAGTDYADAVPPVAGDQVVYDLQYFISVSSTGVITVNDNAPASFETTVYLIDSNGMQEFTVNSGQSNYPSATIDTAPQTVTVGQTLQLQATTADATTLQWTCTSGQTPTFSDPSVEDPTVTLNEAGAHTLQLTATNESGSVTATIELTGGSVEQKGPTAVIQGGDRTVPANQRVYLYSTGSSGGDGTIVSRQWTNDRGALINNDQSALADFDPLPYAGGVVQVTLTIVNSNGDSDSATAAITIEAVNQPPVVTVGQDVTIPINQPYQLVGSVIDPEGDATTAKWTASPATGVTFEDDTEVEPVITISEPGDYAFELTATDFFGNVSEPATMTVTATELSVVTSTITLTVTGGMPNAEYYVRLWVDPYIDKPVFEGLVQFTNGTAVIEGIDVVPGTELIGSVLSVIYAGPHVKGVTV